VNLATKSDFSSLNVQLSEKLFNSTLKYDLQQKHIREMFLREVEALKQDTTMLKKTVDSEMTLFKSEVKMSLTALEKEKNSEKAFYRSEVEQLENRLIKYALGFIVSASALVLSAIRLMTV